MSMSSYGEPRIRATGPAGCHHTRAGLPPSRANHCEPARVNPGKAGLTLLPDIELMMRRRPSMLHAVLAQQVGGMGRKLD